MKKHLGGLIEGPNLDGEYWIRLGLVTIGTGRADGFPWWVDVLFAVSDIACGVLNLLLLPMRRRADNVRLQAWALDRLERRLQKAGGER